MNCGICGENKSKRTISGIPMCEECFAKSFNEFFEYDVVTVINKDHGTIDKQEMMKILDDHAKNGWKLHTIYSNELDKNADSKFIYWYNRCTNFMRSKLIQKIIRLLNE